MDKNRKRSKKTLALSSPIQISSSPKDRKKKSHRKKKDEFKSIKVSEETESEQVTNIVEIAEKIIEVDIVEEVKKESEDTENLIELREKKEETIEKNYFLAKNKLDITIYVSTYYKWRVGWGDLIRIMEPVEIEPNESRKIKKPQMQADKTIKLVATVNKNELPPKLTNKGLERLPYIGIETVGVIYVDYIHSSKASNYKCYSSFQYQSKKSSHTLSSSLEHITKTKRKRGPLSTSSVSLISPNDNENDPVGEGEELESLKYKNKLEELPLVQVGRPQLCEEELQFLEKRKEITRKGLEKFLGLPEGELTDDIAPRIAFCGSGGGARAMICTLGTLMGLSEIGIEDCLTYVTGLSGSTWTFSVWEALHLSVNVRYKFEHGFMIKITTPALTELKEILSAKFLYNHSKVNTVNDCYAAQLAVHLLRDSTPAASKFKLSDLARTANLLEGEYPLPIFVSAVLEPNNLYEWFEFTPFMIGSSYYDCWVPTKLFGAKFIAGKLQPSSSPQVTSKKKSTPKSLRRKRAGSSIQFSSVVPSPTLSEKKTDHHQFPLVKKEVNDPNPNAERLLGEFDNSQELCLAYLLATFASAFCAPWRRVANEFFEKMEVQPISLLSENLFEKRHTVSEWLIKFKLSENHAIEPPLFRNYMYAMKESPLRKLKYFPLVDAGIDFNLPFPPLLDPLRKVDIIIAANASRVPEIADNYCLHSAIKYADRKKLKFPKIDFEKEQNGKLIYEKPVSVFLDENDPDCPAIIYLPLNKNEEYKADFDPQENARLGGYCGTFNFDVNPEQFNELTGLTRYNAVAAKQVLLDTIKYKISLKKSRIK